MLCDVSAIAIAPGETIIELLKIRGMSRKEFAARMGMSDKHISRLINGEAELTRDVAARLESALGVPASFWDNLEAIYREDLIRVASGRGRSHG
jgi:HTH-type transcriptional regulator/antitoxin HigA